MPTLTRAICRFSSPSQNFWCTVFNNFQWLFYISELFKVPKHGTCLRWVTTKKQKWCQFLENLHKYSLKYIGFNHAKQIMGYHACFLDILTNITHEIRDKTTYYHPLRLVSDYEGLSYHFMSKLYSNISKPSMVTPHLLCMDETHVLPGIFLEIYKKMTSLLFFCSDPPWVTTVHRNLIEKVFVGVIKFTGEHKVR